MFAYILRSLECISESFYLNRVLTVFFYRKGGLLLNNLLGIVGAVLMGCTKLFQLYEFLFLGRFIIGVNCGKMDHNKCICDILMAMNAEITV
jgi:hypothetical protein